MAILALDERRIAAKRNSIIPCIVHETHDKGQLCCELNLMHRTLKAVYSKFILTQPGKVSHESIACLESNDCIGLYCILSDYRSDDGARFVLL